MDTPHRKAFATNISSDVFIRYKKLSKRTGKKLSRMTDEAIQDFLAKYEEKGGSIVNSTEEKTEKTPHVICITNNKGGVGKTTTTSALAYLFAKKGHKKVLLIDADAQMNLTAIMVRRDTDGNPVIDRKKNIKNALVDSIQNFPIPIEALIEETKYKDIDFIAGDEIINKEKMLAEIRQARLDTGLNAWVGIIEKIKELNRYDIILVDTHPSTSTETLLPMQACNEVLVPMEASESSIIGLQQVYKNIKMSRRVKPSLKFLGAFFNKVKSQTSSAKEYIPSVRRNIPEYIKSENGGISDGRIFNAVIRDSEDARKAENFHSSVTERYGSKKISKDFEKLYDEVTALYE